MSNNRNHGNRGQMPVMPASPAVDAESLLAPAEPMPEEPKMEAPKVEKVAVVATRLGFFNGKRMVEGEMFQLDSMKQFGSWMKLADPVAEKKRQEELKKKKEAGK